MFPLKTKAEKQIAQNILARDIKKCSNAVKEEMTHLCEGDITKMLQKLPDIRAATIECYAGNCSFCPADSLVCSGEGIGCWWYKSDILSPTNLKYLQMNDNDKHLMEIILQMRLSEEAVYSVSSRTSTQKCEAFNRAVSATLSKNISYSRNFKGRLAAQILRSNNNVDAAVKKKLRKVSGTGLCIWAQRRLKRVSNKSRYHKTYRASARSKGT